MVAVVAAVVALVAVVAITWYLPVGSSSIGSDGSCQDTVIGT